MPQVPMMRMSALRSAGGRSGSKMADAREAEFSMSANTAILSAIAVASGRSHSSARWRAKRPHEVIWWSRM